MSRVTIYTQGPFSVVSCGNGTGYEFHSGPVSAYYQGDDATAFREDLELIYEAASDPAGHVARKGALAWLWDECGYGESAQ